MVLEDLAKALAMMTNNVDSQIQSEIIDNFIIVQYKNEKQTMGNILNFIRYFQRCF